MKIPFTRAAVRIGLATLGFSCFSVCAAVLYISFRTARHFDGIGGFAVGVIAPLAFGSLFLLSAARWSFSNQLRLTAVVGLSVVLLLAFELYLARTVAGRSTQRPVDPTILAVSAESGIRFDPRTPAEVVRDLRLRGTQAVLSLAPRLLLKEQPDGSLRSVMEVNGAETLPLGGIPNHLTIWCNEFGDYTFYEADGRGFRNPGHVWKLRSIDIAIVGNSFAMGACMPPWKGFVDRIRSVHPATLNLAMGHDGPLLELATLKEYLTELRPGIVLWFYEEENDLRHLKGERHSPLLLRYLKEGPHQALTSRQSEIDKALMRQGERELRSQLSTTEPRDDLAAYINDTIKLRQVRRELSLPVWRRTTTRTVEAADIELLREILQEANETTSRWGGRLVFVYLAGKTRYAEDVSPFGEARERILALVARLGIPTIDAQAVFDAHQDPLSLFPFRRFYHYTERGHELIADQVIGCISRRDFIRTSTRCPSVVSATRK